MKLIMTWGTPPGGGMISSWPVTPVDAKDRPVPEELLLTDATKQACEFCRYGERNDMAWHEPSPQALRCRRYPPAVNRGRGDGSDYMWGLWPIVAPDDVCGEFKERL